MKRWALFLHFYQPPTQEIQITKDILTFCYLPMLRMLREKSNFGITINMSGCLLLQIKEIGNTEFFEITKELVADGKVEIVGSVLNHPLMSTIADSVVNRQLTNNQQVLFETLGVSKTTGFFPPELAVSEKVIAHIPHEYFVIDETAVNSNNPLIRYKDKYALVSNRKISEILRAYPNKLKASLLIEAIERELTVTANDAELFGHHYTERLEVLEELIDSPEIELITMSKAIELYGKDVPRSKNIKKSTWQNTKKFDLWMRNPLQIKYLKLLELGAQAEHDPVLYDKATSSCYLYWLSNWPWWHPGLVEKGVMNLKMSVYDKDLQKLCDKFLESMWRYHNSGKVERNYKKYEEYNKTLTKLN